MSATPVYSELWFILLLALLGLFLLALLLGLVLQRYGKLQNFSLRKNQQNDVMTFFSPSLSSQSLEEESLSQRAPSAGHPAEEQEGRRGGVHGERSRL